MIVIGHQSILNFFKQAIKASKLSHSYLFYGPANVGKFTTALWLAKILQCQESSPDAFCNQCVNCRHVDKSIHPDIYSIKKKEDKQAITIFQIRELQKKLQTTSFHNNKKIAIIKNAESLNLEAANCLLKTLEEPSAKSLLILTVQNKVRLPLTILSRCQIINFSLLNKQEIAESQSHSPDYGVMGGFLKDYQSLGRPGLLEQEQLSEFENYEDLFFKILQEPVYKSFGFLEEKLTQAKWQDLFYIFKILLRDLLLYGLDSQEKIVLQRYLSQYSRLSSSYKSDRLISLLSKIQETEDLIKQNVHPKLAWENLILNFKMG